MTLCPEVVLAKEAGILYASIAMATDYDCWRDSVVNVEAVMETFKKNVEKVKILVIACVKAVSQLDWTETIDDLKQVVNSSIMLPNQYSK
jgi:5'-methylthioadenosine phosphorylase